MVEDPLVSSWLFWSGSFVVSFVVFVCALKGWCSNMRIDSWPVLSITPDCWSITSRVDDKWTAEGDGATLRLIIVGSGGCKLGSRRHATGEVPPPCGPSSAVLTSSHFVVLVLQAKNTFPCVSAYYSVGPSCRSAQFRSPTGRCLLLTLQKQLHCIPYLSSGCALPTSEFRSVK